MNAPQARAPVLAGESAPDFSLPAVHRDGTVSLSDYKGRAPLVLAIFRGLYCPFCRRAIAQFSAMSDKLKAMGIETLAVVATETDNAKMYFRHRPVKIQLAADEGCTIHLAYGLPSMAPDENIMKALEATEINPTGELPRPTSLLKAANDLNQIHGYALTEADQRDTARQPAQIKG